MNNDEREQAAGSSSGLGSISSTAIKQQRQQHRTDADLSVSIQTGQSRNSREFPGIAWMFVATISHKFTGP